MISPVIMKLKCGKVGSFLSYINVQLTITTGVTFQKVSNPSSGVSQNDYYYAINIWRRNQLIRRNMPGAGPNPLPNKRHIGYVGVDYDTSQRYKQGQRRLKSSRPSRWGWAMYVADNPEMWAAVFPCFCCQLIHTWCSAAVFARWLRESEPNNQFFCKVFVRDFEEFKQMSKVCRIVFFSSTILTYFRQLGLGCRKWINSTDRQPPHFRWSDRGRPNQPWSTHRTELCAICDPQALHSLL